MNVKRDSTTPPTRSKLPRTEGQLLVNAMGNALAVLVFKFEAIKRHPGGGPEFEAAMESAIQELWGFKELIGRAAELLAVGGDGGKVETHTGPARSNESGVEPHAAIAGSLAAIRVLCVDDDADVTASMRLTIDAEPDMRCVGCLGSTDALLVEVRRLCLPPGDGVLVVILKAAMPGRSELELVSELAGTLPQVRTIISCDRVDREFIDRAVYAGAWGCTSKLDGPESITESVRTAAAFRAGSTIGRAAGQRDGER